MQRSDRAAACKCPVEIAGDGQSLRIDFDDRVDCGAGIINGFHAL